MTPEERQERINELFGTAIEREPSQWDSFLTQACDDDEIRQEVRSLLTAHQRAGTFLQSPPCGPPISTPPHTSIAPAISEVASREISERYEILAEVGRGGMGIVYRARDRETNDVVALKMLKPEIAAEPRVVERFKQELRLARKVTHKNVCRTHELLRFDDTVVIAMEYVEGESLREVLKRPGGVRLRRALEWTAQICEALAEAHAHGVVHRDLKPENILIDRSGQVKVMDFGIARSLEAGATTTGSIVGTPAYMAPEQAEGKPVDHRADIYALGLILFEMFTGQLAFRAETPTALAFKHVHEAPAVPRELEPTLPDYIEQAILKCLEKEPAGRFQSARELEAALTEKHVAPVRLKPRFPPVVLTLLLLALMAVPLVFLGKWLGRTVQPSYHRLTFRRGEITSARLHPNGTIVYSAASEGEPVQLFATSSKSPESRPLDLTGYTVFSISQKEEMLLSDKNSTLAVRSFNGGGPQELRKEVEWADWAPDGTNYALVYDADGNDRLEYPAGDVLYETTGWISDLRISPKGDTAAFIEHPIQDDARGSVVVVDMKGNRMTLSGEYLNARGLAWSPRGKEVWFTADRTGHARALYAATLSGKERLVQRTPGSLYLRDISSDGRILIELANERGFIRGLLSGDTGERDLSWLDYSSASDLSRDGKVLLFDEEGEGGGGKHAVYLRETASSAPIRLGDGVAAALSPDGKWALSVLDTAPRKLVLLPTHAGESRNLPSGSIEKFYSAQWFPDGKRILLTASQPAHRLRCYVQDLAGGIPFPKTPEGTYGCSASTDNRFILATGPKEKVSLYPLAGGQPVPIPGLDSDDELIRFAEDGHHLYIYSESKSQAKVIKVYRLDTTTGKKELWKEIKVPDPAVDTLDSMLLTPDGKYYVCNFERVVSDLYLVEGLK